MRHAGLWVLSKCRALRTKNTIGQMEGPTLNSSFCALVFLLKLLRTLLLEAPLAGLDRGVTNPSTSEPVNVRNLTFVDTRTAVSFSGRHIVIRIDPAIYAGNSSVRKVVRGVPEELFLLECSCDEASSYSSLSLPEPTLKRSGKPVRTSAARFSEHTQRVHRTKNKVCQQAEGPCVQSLRT